MTTAPSSSRLLITFRNVKKSAYSRSCECPRPNSQFRRSLSENCVVRIPIASSSSRITFLHLSPLHARSPASHPSFSSSSRTNKFASRSDREDTELEPMTPSSLRAARQRGDWAVSYLRAQFPPLEFPPDVAQRILTHSSWRAGAQTYGHNTRLGFIGRRVMQSYLMLFLQSVSPASIDGRGARLSSKELEKLKSRDPEGSQAMDVIDFEELAEKILDTHVVGTLVGEVLHLENIMRWTDAKNPSDSAGPLTAGMRKVRGATVEAIMGGIFHQFGGVAAEIAFHTRVLPLLVPVMPDSLAPKVEEACIQLGGREASLRPGDVNAGTPTRTEPPIPTWSTPPPPSRRVASA